MREIDQSSDQLIDQRIDAVWSKLQSAVATTAPAGVPDFETFLAAGRGGSSSIRFKGYILPLKNDLFRERDDLPPAAKMVQSPILSA